MVEEERLGGWRGAGEESEGEKEGVAVGSGGWMTGLREMVPSFSSLFDMTLLQLLPSCLH
jgi:hypothetical protein